MWIRYDAESRTWITHLDHHNTPSKARSFVASRVKHVRMPLFVVVSVDRRTVWLESADIFAAKMKAQYTGKVAEGMFPEIWDTYIAHCRMAETT